MNATKSNGIIPEIINNEKGIYIGNLRHYFRVVFKEAQNLNRSYHNFRHMFHVLWQCYNACIYYGKRISKRQARNLFIAAIFHDFDHSGMMGSDDLNIIRAIRGLEKHLLEEDKPHLVEIANLIRVTEFPYSIPNEDLGLCEEIIRDADMTQAFSVAWIQQVVFGLANEWRKEPIEVLRAQSRFLGNLEFLTTWARKLYPKEEIAAKIAEGEALLEILGGE